MEHFSRTLQNQKEAIRFKKNCVSSLESVNKSFTNLENWKFSDPFYDLVTHQLQYLLNARGLLSRMRKIGLTLPEKCVKTAADGEKNWRNFRKQFFYKKKAQLLAMWKCYFNLEHFNGASASAAVVINKSTHLTVKSKCGLYDEGNIQGRVFERGNYFVEAHMFILWSAISSVGIVWLVMLIYFISTI